MRDWAPIWIALIIVGVIMVTLSQIAGVRAWAGRVFGRVLPDLSGWGGALKALASSNVLRIGVLVLMIGAPVTIGLVRYFERSGAKDVLLDIAEGEVRVKDIVIERNTDIGAIASEVSALRAQFRELANRGRDEIAAAAPPNEAPIDAGAVAAWRASLDRLCVRRPDLSFADTCRPVA